MNKNHLVTSEEQNRKSNRDLKRVITSNYIGNPPTITRNLDEAGIVQKTENQVRDTDFPLLANIEDLTDNIHTTLVGTVKTIQVELGKQVAQFHRLKLDDDSGVITDFVIDFIGLAKNKALEFIMDIQTIFTGTPSITFNPTLDGLPTSFGGTGNNTCKLVVSAIDTPIIESYEVLNGTAAAGGINFPIDFPEETDRGTVTITQTIDFASSTRHSVSMTIGAASVALDFDNPPTNELAITSITVKQDSPTGGREISFVDTVVNEQVIFDAFEASSPGQGISFVVEWERGIFTAYLKTGNVVSAGGTSVLSGLTIDVNKDWATKSITNLAAIQYVDLGAVVRGSISGDAGASALRLATASGGKFLISDVITDIAEFTDAVGLQILGTHVINMTKNIINTIGSLQFDATVTFTPLAVNTIGFDSALNAMKYNVALVTDAHQFQTNGELLATITRFASNSGLLTIDNILADLINVTEIVDFATFTNSTPADGQIWLNLGDGLFNFRQNGVTEVLGAEVFTWTADHFADGNDLRTVDRLQMIGGTTSPTSSADYVWYITTGSPGDLVSNVPAAADWGWTSNNVTKMILTDDALEKRNGTAPTFQLYNTRAAAVGAAGTIAINANSTLTSTGVAMGFMVADTEDIASDGTGSLRLGVRVAGTPTNYVTINDNDDGIVRSLFDLTVEKNSSVAADEATVNIVKVDSTPADGENIAALNFQVNDDGVVETYGSIAVENIDVTDNAVMSFLVRADNGLITAMSLTGDGNNQRFMMLMGGTDQARIQPGLGEMGYFVTSQVTDFSLVIGTSGSLEIPQINDGSPSLTDLNQAFGAFDGAIGQDISDGNLYVRKSATVWSCYAESTTVT